MKFLQIHQELNPKLWEPRGTLKSSVRGALLRIAQDFRQFVDIDFPIVDIVITGSNVNYNYQEDSDLDLHLVSDYKRTDCDDELEELFDTKRHLYEQTHDIRIYGIPVTLYVEDLSTPGVSAGLYSVKQNKWLQKPQRVQPNINSKEIQAMLAVWQIILSHSEHAQDLDTLITTQHLLRQYRKQGLKLPQGEFSTPNLVYKALRSDGSLQRLNDLIIKLEDQELSIG